MKIKVNLNNAKSIKDALRQIDNYKKRLRVAFREMVEEVAQAGIDAAYVHSGEYGGMILYRKKTDESQSGFRCIFYAEDAQKIVSTWKRGGGEVSAEVSPLLMAEFGSGWAVEILENVEGVGQGTFPGQTHAFDPKGWFWEDRNPEGGTPTKDGYYLHHSRGQAPTHPVHHARLAMQAELDRLRK